MASEVREDLALGELVTDAMNAFCDDMATMFQVELTCTEPTWIEAPLEQFKRFFKKVYAVHVIKAEGRLEGRFYILLDHGSLFTLAGLATMLPEDRIKELAKRGDLKDVGSVADALGETGNLLVGAWERVFQKDLVGHKHLSKELTVIGDPDQDPYQYIQISSQEPLHIGQLQMGVSGYAPFDCAVLMPNSVMAGQRNDKVVEQTLDQATSTQVDTQTQPPDPDVKQVRQTTDTTTAGQTPCLDQGQVGLYQALECKVSRVMCREVVWAGPEQDIQQVLQLMQSKDVGYVLIGHEGRLDGIVSRSSVLAGISPYLRPVFAKWRRPEDDATLTIRIRWFMSRPVRTIDKDATVFQAAATMLRFGIRALPVIDENGQAVGIVTVFDLLRSLHKDLATITPPQAPGLML